MVIDKRIFLKISLVLLIFVIILFMNNAHAKEIQDTLNTLVFTYEAAITSFADAMIKWAKWLFTALAVISLTWSFGTLALKGGQDFANVGFEMVRAVLVIGFFWWLISEFPFVVEDIFSQFGNFAAGLAGISSSSNIGDLANKLLVQTFKTGTHLMHIKGFEDLWDIQLGMFFASLLAFLVGIFVVVTSIFIAMNVIIMYVEFLFTCYCGIFILGMAGASWTRDSAISYLRKLLAQSTSFLCMILVMNAGLTLTTGSTQEYDAVIKAGGDDVGSNMFMALMGLLASYLVFIKVVQVIPQAVSGILGGGSAAGYNPTAAATAIGGMAVGGAVAAAGYGIGKAGMAAGKLGMAGLKGLGGMAGGLAKGAGSVASKLGNKALNAANSVASGVGSVSSRIAQGVYKRSDALQAVGGGLNNAAKTLNNLNKSAHELENKAKDLVTSPVNKFSSAVKSNIQKADQKLTEFAQGPKK